MSPIHVAIIGTGMSLTVFHHPLIAALPDQYTLHSVVERSGKATAKKICGEHVKIVTTLEEVLDDEVVDLVVVSTPNRTHMEYCKRALEAGKHVMCEKPLVPTAAEAEELFEIARSKGKILCVYQNRRWDSDYLTVKEIVESGKLGPLVEFTSYYDRYKPLTVVQKDAWKEKAGEHNDSIYNLGSHLIDQALTLFGKPDKVSCRSWAARGVEGLDDSYVLDMFYPPPEGASGPLIVTTRAAILSAVDPQLRFSVKGTKGSFTKYGLDPQEAHLKAGGKARAAGYGVEDKAMWGHIQMVKEEGAEVLNPKEPYPAVKGDYPAIYENLFEAIAAKDSSKLIVKPEQAILNIRVIEAGLRSSREGRTVTI